MRNGYELKTLEDASTYSTIDGYVHGTSKKKKGTSAIVFDNYENKNLDDKILIEFWSSGILTGNQTSRTLSITADSFGAVAF